VAQAVCIRMAPYPPPSEAAAELERAGYVVLPNAIPEPLRARLERACDRVYGDQAAGGGALHLLGFLTRDRAFCELLDLPATLPVVREVLGWNVYAYHSHLDVHPPLAAPSPPRWRWHQDGLRQNLEALADPSRPRLSVKIAFLLTDLTRPGRGNTLVLPRSHRRNTLARPARPELGFRHPRGARPLVAAAGSAVVFDRRLWHAATDNTSKLTRKVLFVAYTYRWVRPREDYLHNAPAWVARLSPLRRQLLGGTVTACGHWEPQEADVPLRNWPAPAG
jgi:ectoine hydroxylase